MSQAGSLGSGGGGGGGTLTSVTTTNATPQFVLTGTNENINFGLLNLVLGTSMPALTSGSLNVGMGFNVFSSLTSANECVGIGFDALHLATTASFCTAIGAVSQQNNLTSNSNTSVGQDSLGALASGLGSNVAFGLDSLIGLGTGAYNIAMGVSSGSQYTAAESSNIVIGNLGVAGESNVIRIGSQGSGATQQNKCFVAGITSASPVTGNIPQVALCDNAGQITTISSSTSGFVLTSNGAGTPSFQAAGGGVSPVPFLAYLATSQANVIGNGTAYQIPFDTVAFGTFTTGASASFVAPATGKYFLSASASTNFGTNAVAYFSVSIIATSRSLCSETEVGAAAYSGGRASQAVSGVIDMTSGDTAYVSAYSVGAGTNNSSINGSDNSPQTGQYQSYFSGYRIS